MFEYECEEGNGRRWRVEIRVIQTVVLIVVIVGDVPAAVIDLV